MRRVAEQRNPVKNKFGEGKHGFGPGDPQSGMAATTPGYEWFDAVQEELAGLIKAAGIKLDAGKTDQLKLAITKLVSDAAAPVKHGHAWADISKTPSTLEGYGITDAVSSHELAQALTEANKVLNSKLDRTEFAGQWDARLAQRMTFQY